MALNNSGPLSFGGTTVGQSINLELGVSATALASIDSTAFRTLAGVSSGTISVSNFYGKSNISYYIALFTAPSQGCVFRGGSVDSAGNVYIGSHNGYADQGSFLKLTTNASAIGFQKLISTGFPNIYEPKMIARNDSTTAIVVGQFQGNDNKIWYAKVNPSTGAIIWQTYIRASGSTYSYNFGYYLHTNGDIYSAGYFGGLGRVTHLDSNGNNAGSYELPGQAYSVVADSSNQMYITLRRSGYGTVYKMDSSGYITWASREDTGSFGIYGLNNIQWAPSGHVYCMGYQYYGGSYTSNIWKLTASLGAQVWSRRITSTTNIMQSLAIDSAENVYLCGYNSDTNAALIIKYNSSGTLQWARSFICSPGNTTVFTSIQIFNDSTLFVQGYYTPINYPTGIVCCFPTDGSKTGTYTVGGVTCTYAAVTYTDIAGINMTSAPGYTPASLTQESATQSPTDWNASKTSTAL